MANIFPTKWLRESMANNLEGEENESIIIEKLAFFDVALNEDSVELPAKPILEFDLDSWINEHGIVCYSATPVVKEQKGRGEREPLRISPEKTLLGAALVTKTEKIAIVIDHIMSPDADHEFSMPIMLAF